MFARHLRLAFRHLARKPLFTTLNLLGLATGLACALVLMRFIQHELSYDRDVAHADRIWRFAVDIQNGDNRTDTARTGWGPGPVLVDDFVDIEEMTRIGFARDLLVSFDEMSTRVDMMLKGEPNLLTFMSIPLIEGNPETALTRPNCVVVSQRVSKALFGDESPIGKMVDLNHGLTAEITGVLGESGPRHFDGEMIISQTEDPNLGHVANGWLWLAFHTYFRLREGGDIQTVTAGLKDFVARHAAEYVKLTGTIIYPRITPLTDIHLKSHLAAELGTNGDMTNVIVFASIALIVVLIASINFINLSTAQASARAAEVGLRKVVGAQKRELFGQFLTESLLMTGTAFLLSLLLAFLAMPLFNRIAGTELTLDLVKNLPLLAEFAALFLFVGLLAGGIPALALSSFKPLDVLRGQLQRGRKAARVRKGLVVLQFAASVTLIIGTFVVIKQLGYLNSRDLGFKQDHLVTLRLRNEELLKRSDLFREMLLKNPVIESAAASMTVPGRGHGSRLIKPEGIPENETRRAGLVTVDPEYLETFDIQLVEGRFFERGRPSDSTAWVINESMARELGWNDPLSMTFDYPPGGDFIGPVIGVVRDFHHLSLHNPVEAMVFRLADDAKTYMTVRISSGNLNEALEYIESTWSEFAPDWPFEYEFIDEMVSSNYKEDSRFGEMFGAFASLAIFVAALGLLGLAAFTAQARTREIGVRKVLGAETQSIVMLLTRDFMTLVLVGNALAWPIAWYTMDRWLDGFAYRTSVGIWPILASMLLSLIVAFATIAGHAFRAARVNPATTIRTE